MKFDDLKKKYAHLAEPKAAGAEDYSAHLAKCIDFMRPLIFQARDSLAELGIKADVLEDTPITDRMERKQITVDGHPRP